MLSSIDGKIDGTSLRHVADGTDYELTGAKLHGDAWVCGRTTMQMHFAEKRLFVSKTRKHAGSETVHVAQRAGSYAISIDTLGRLRWSDGDVGGDHLICVVSERARADYLTYLREKGISYIVTGKASVNLTNAVALLRKHFGIRRLLLEGGGHINGAFLKARLVDEISLLLAPGIDGRKGIAAVFDGLDSSTKKAVPLKLTSFEKRKHGTLWIHYKVMQ